MTEVRILSNPLKVVKCKGTFQEGQKDYFNVPIIPTYMDLTKGVWCISLDTYTVKFNKPDEIETVLEISSSVATNYEPLEETGRHVSSHTPLGHIYAVGSKDVCLFGNFEKKWFLVEEHPFGFVEIYIKQSSLCKVEKLEFSFEFTLLFQRQK